MPDIIKQLEEGKKLQEEQGIDVDSLRTKLNSEEETKESEKKKRGRKKKESNNEIQQEEQQEQVAPPINVKEPEKSEKIEDEKYPGFDFSNYYEVGQIVFYVRAIENMGIKELLDLRVRTIYPKMMICCEKGKMAHCIGVDKKDSLFINRNDALEAYNNLAFEAKKSVTTNVSLEEEQEEEENEQD